MNLLRGANGCEREKCRKRSEIPKICHANKFNSTLLANGRHSNLAGHDFSVPDCLFGGPQCSETNLVKVFRANGNHRNSFLVEADLPILAQTSLNRERAARLPVCPASIAE